LMYFADIVSCTERTWRLRVICALERKQLQQMTLLKEDCH
jgi:hypothetical protein